MKDRPNIAIFLNLGDSIETQQSSGQWSRFCGEYLVRYSKFFSHVYIFSYGKLNSSSGLPQNCIVVSNNMGWHRWLYTWLVPFLHSHTLRSCNVTRTMQATGGIPAILSQLLWKVPSIITYGYDYGSFAELQQNQLSRWITEVYVDWILRITKRIIVTTEENYKKFHQYQSKIVKIPNSVNLSRFKLKSNYVLHSPMRVVSVGRLVRQKRFGLALESISLLDSTCELHIVGRGTEQQFLQSEADRLKVALKMLDPIPHDEIARFLNSGDLYIQTSRMEGHPKALLEAMAVGLPCVVVVSKNNVYDFLEDKKNCLLVSENSDDISAVLRMLSINLNLRKRLGIAARKTIEQKFNLQKLLTEEIQLLTDMAANK